MSAERRRDGKRERQRDGETERQKDKEKERKGDLDFLFSPTFRLSVSLSL